MRNTVINTPLGRVRLAATEIGLAGLWFEGQKHSPDTTGWQDDPGHPVLREAALQLLAYLDGQRRGFDLRLDLSRGTPFQQTVWNALLTIPRGTTMSYGNLSQIVGKPTAVRAVGAAVGRNPISVIVPCHRVLGADGSLTGFASGLERKHALLTLEDALASDVYYLPGMAP